MAKQFKDEGVQPAEGIDGSIPSEPITTVGLRSTEVSNGAKQISPEEAAMLAADEIARLTEELAAKVAENITISGDLEAAKKQIEELSTQVNTISKKIEDAALGQDNTILLNFLDNLATQLEEYTGMRRERLRREFVTDLTELIEKTRESLQ